LGLGMGQETFLVAGGLLIGAGLFLGGYASLANPFTSILTVLFLLSGVLFSEAMFADKPALYVLASALLAITAGCCFVVGDLLALPAGACCLSGPILVAKGLRALKEGATP